MSNTQRRLAGVRLRPEEEAVLLCARAVRDRAEHERLRELLEGADGLDDARFWAEAFEQQVQTLVAGTLVSEALYPRVPDAAQQLKELRLRMLTHNLCLDAELGRIAAKLHTRGIPVAPLKGTRLAQRLFDGLDARQIGDIDILVQVSQLDEARGVLRELGYQQSNDASSAFHDHSFHGAPWFRETPTGRMIVELHWGLTDPQFLNIDYPALWERILAGSSEHDALRPLPAEETLLFLALHLPKHAIGVLRLLVDIDRLVRREGATIDWSYAVALAKQWNVDVLVYFALDRAEQLLNTPVPDGVMQQLAPGAWRRGLVELLAGARSILRPPADQDSRYNRFQLAYCAMLTPLDNSLAAYVRYLFTQFGPRRPGIAGRMRDMTRRVVHGIGWTVLVIADALRELVRDWLAWPTPAPALPGGWVGSGASVWASEPAVTSEGKPEINRLLTVGEEPRQYGSGDPVRLGTHLRAER